MALIPMRVLLDHAAENNYGVAAFNVNNMEQIQAIMEAAKETNSPVIVQATFGIASVVLAESSLSFLGLGVPPGTPTWGAMLADGREVLFEAPRVSMLPGVAIFLTVLSANLLGDVARDRYDPKAQST